MAPVEEKPTSPSDGPETGSGQTGPSSGSTNKAPTDDNSAGSTPPPPVPAKPSSSNDPSPQSPDTPPSHSAPANSPPQAPSDNSPPKSSPIPPPTQPNDPSAAPNEPPPAPSAPAKSSSTFHPQSTPSGNNGSGTGNTGGNGSNEGAPVQPTPPTSGSTNHQFGNNAPDGNGSTKPSQGQSGPSLPSKPSISPPFGDPKGTGIRPPLPTKTSGAGNNNPTSSIISKFGAVSSESNNLNGEVPTKTEDSHPPTFSPFDGSNSGEEPSGPKFGSSPSLGNPGFSSVSVGEPSPSQNLPGPQGGRPNSSSKGLSVSSTTMSNGLLGPLRGTSSFTPFDGPGPTRSFPVPSSTISNKLPDPTDNPGIPSPTFKGPDRTLSSSLTPPPISSLSQDKGPTTTNIPVHGPNDPLSSLSLPLIPSPTPSQSTLTSPHESSIQNPSLTQTSAGSDRPTPPVQSFTTPFSDPTNVHGPDRDPSSTQKTQPSNTLDDPSKGGDNNPIPKPPVSSSSPQNQPVNDPKPSGNDPKSTVNGPKPTGNAPSQPLSPSKSSVETLSSTHIPGNNGQTPTLQAQSATSKSNISSSKLTFSAPPSPSPSPSTTAPPLPPVRAASSAPPGSSSLSRLSLPLGGLQSHGTNIGSTKSPSVSTIVSTRSATTSFFPTSFPSTVTSGPTPVITFLPTTFATVLPLSTFTSFSTITSMPTPNSVAATSSESSHTGPIVGAFVGAVFAALILAAISFYIIRRKRRSRAILLQDDMAFTGGGGAGVSVPQPPPSLAGGLFNPSETPYSPVSITEHDNETNRRSETDQSRSHPTGGDYQRVLAQSSSMESLRESLMGITRLSPVPQLLLGDPFGDHSRMDDSDDDRSTFRDGSSVGHGSAHSIRSSPSIRSNLSTTSTVRVKRTFRTITASPTPMAEGNNPFADNNNNILIDHPGPSSAEFINDPFADDLLGQADHLSAESSNTATRNISRLSAGSAITNVSYEPSEDGTIGYAL